VLLGTLTCETSITPSPTCPPYLLGPDVREDEERREDDGRRESKREEEE